MLNVHLIEIVEKFEDLLLRVLKIDKKFDYRRLN